MISLTSVLNFAWTIGLSVWRVVRMILFALSNVTKNFSSAERRVLVKLIVRRVVKVVTLSSVSVGTRSQVLNLSSVRKGSSVFLF